MKALRQLEYAQPLQVCDLPIPRAEPGLAVVKVLVCPVVSYAREVYDGTRKTPYPTPLTVGSHGIGRIHELGPDATSLKLNDLVLVDVMIRARDDPSVAFLSTVHEGFSSGSKALAAYWRDGKFAEYAAAPLENCYKINDDVLKSVENGGLGYYLSDLLYIPICLVPYGGLTDIEIRQGETVIIAPATGGLGGAAVHVALSMSARVIAMGRNQKSLEKLVEMYGSERLVTVPIVEKLEDQVAALSKAARGRDVDAVFDISPPQAIGSVHLKAAILVLKHSGRVSLMGGQQGDVGIPHSKVMHSNISLKGKWMYERRDVKRFISLVEGGIVKLGKAGGLNVVEPAKMFQLEDWKNAFDYAFENIGAGVRAYLEVAA